MSALPTMIIADDHVHIREGVRVMIEEMQLADVVDTASRGDQALELIRQHRPQIALVDQRMSGMTGVEIAAAVQQEQLPTAVVILSAFTNTRLVRLAIRSGAAGYIAKDSSEDSFRVVVNDVLQGRSVVDPALMHLLLKGDAEAELSDRQIEVLQRVALGQMNEAIAVEMGVATETVKSHVSTIMRKFGAKTRTEAVAIAMREALVD